MEKLSLVVETKLSVMEVKSVKEFIRRRFGRIPRLGEGRVVT